jgi:hypothetical protein
VNYIVNNEKRGRAIRSSRRKKTTPTYMTEIITGIKITYEKDISRPHENI